MKYCFYLLIACFTIIFSSCKDDETKPSDCNNLEKINLNGKPSREIIYKAGHIDRINLYSNSLGYQGYYKYTYNSFNFLKEIQFIKAPGDTILNIYKYSYNTDASLNNITVYYAAGDDFMPAYGQRFAYNSQKQVSEITSFGVGEEGFADNEKTVLEYDTKGNVTTAKRYYIENGNAEYTDMRQMEYDDKQNAAKTIAQDLTNMTVYDLCTNNVTKVVFLSRSGDVIQTNNYTYEYNDSGFPAQANVSVSTGTKITFTYSYTCK